jgi:glucan 1,3-beta-glucosidase
MRKYWEAQVVAFEKSQGWIYWTWKAENADEWSYQAGLAGGESIFRVCLLHPVT